MGHKIKFAKDNQGFYSEVNEKVNQYFKENNLSKHANAYMVFKSVFSYAVLFSSYFALIWGGFNVWINDLLWIAIGLSSVFIAVNVGHDAIHGSYSSKKWVNRLLSVFSFNLVGANAYVWSITHNIVHHTYTNIDGADDDLESVPILRLCPEQKWKPIMKAQHIYAFFLFTLGTLSWVFKKDYSKFFRKEIGNYENKRHPAKEYFSLFFYKFLYYFIFIAIPIYMINMPWYVTFGGFVLGHLFEGFVIAITFMLAHVVEGLDFPVPDENGDIKENWAIHQMHTTADFARGSVLVGFLTGGLNYQVEHHLFPKICHVHYPQISKIVEQVAKKHNVPFHSNPTFFSALASHARLLKKLGQNSSVQQGV